MSRMRHRGRQPVDKKRKNKGGCNMGMLILYIIFVFLLSFGPILFIKFLNLLGEAIYESVNIIIKKEN